MSEISRIHPLKTVNVWESLKRKDITVKVIYLLGTLNIFMVVPPIRDKLFHSES